MPAEYLDELTVRVAFGCLMQPPAEVWEMPVAVIGEWDEADYVSQVKSLTFVEGKYFESDITVTKRQVSWGADGATAEILAFITERALNVAEGVLIEEAVRRAFRWFRERSRATAEPIDRETAIDRATYRVALAYQVKRDSLNVVAEEELEKGGWRIELTGGEYRYVVALGVVDGDPNTSRIRRETL